MRKTVEYILMSLVSIILEIMKEISARHKLEGRISFTYLKGLGSVPQDVVEVLKDILKRRSSREGMADRFVTMLIFVTILLLLLLPDLPTTTAKALGFLGITNGLTLECRTMLFGCFIVWMTTSKIWIGNKAYRELAPYLETYNVS